MEAFKNWFKRFFCVHSFSLNGKNDRVYLKYFKVEIAAKDEIVIVEKECKWCGKCEIEVIKTLYPIDRN